MDKSKLNELVGQYMVQTIGKYSVHEKLDRFSETY